jgi:AcrR family transcriptional regulator
MPTAKAKTAVTRRNRQYEKRLSSILKAAAKVIARDGFEGAAIRKVAAAAGIGLSGIYYYFESKDELLFALQSHTFSTLADSLEKRLAVISLPRERLRAVIDIHFQFFASNMNDLKVCVHEIESLSGNYYKRVLKIRRQYYRLVRDVVSENIESTDRYDINLSTLFLFGSLNWAYMWFNPEKNPDISKVANRFLEIFLNGIKK